AVGLQGKPKPAAYEQALAFGSDDPASHWNLALTYMELGRYVDARQHFEAYLALKPNAADEVQPYLDELDWLE
ncbi:MAG: tetratricopeptide repeat protein, partial [Anaerolineae bacterium]